MEQETSLESRAEDGMTSGSVFKSMLPSIIVGTATAVGAQEIASHYTSNPETITLAGMASQYLGGWGTYIPMHLYHNKERLMENGKIKWKECAKDVGSIMASDRVGNKVWAGTYGAINNVAMNYGLDTSTAAMIAGLSSGTVYSAFTGWATPKASVLTHKVTDFAKQFTLNSYTAEGGKIK